MLVEIVDSLEEVFGDGLGRFEIGVVQGGLLQDQEPGLDQVQPGGALVGVHTNSTLSGMGRHKFRSLRCALKLSQTR